MGNTFYQPVKTLMYIYGMSIRKQLVLQKLRRLGLLSGFIQMLLLQYHGLVWNPEITIMIASRIYWVVDRRKLFVSTHPHLFLSATILFWSLFQRGQRLGLRKSFLFQAPRLESLQCIDLITSSWNHLARVPPVLMHGVWSLWLQIGKGGSNHFTIMGYLYLSEI